MSFRISEGGSNSVTKYLKINGARRKEVDCRPGLFLNFKNKCGFFVGKKTRFVVAIPAICLIIICDLKII
jgi:hypothetical protein